jgi:hypothetical protein
MLKRLVTITKTNIIIYHILELTNEQKNDKKKEKNKKFTTFFNDQ